MDQKGASPGVADSGVGISVGTIVGSGEGGFGRRGRRFRGRGFGRRGRRFRGRGFGRRGRRFGGRGFGRRSRRFGRRRFGRRGRRFRGRRFGRRSRRFGGRGFRRFNCRRFGGEIDNDGRRPHMAKRRKQGDFVGRRVVQVNPAGVERQACHDPFGQAWERCTPNPDTNRRSDSLRVRRDRGAESAETAQPCAAQR